jgi:hypothetical protein
MWSGIVSTSTMGTSHSAHTSRMNSRPIRKVSGVDWIVSGVEEIVRYTYRLRPGAQAERALLDEWHRCRFLWNEAVHQQKSGNKPTFGKLSKLLTEARGKSAWLRAGSQVAQQQTLRTYAAALGHSYTVKGRGKPVFKARKKTRPSLEYTTRGSRCATTGCGCPAA